MSTIGNLLWQPFMIWLDDVPLFLNKEDVGKLVFWFEEEKDGDSADEDATDMILFVFELFFIIFII